MRPLVGSPCRAVGHGAILRNLLHLGGQAEYTAKTITVTLDRPDSPRVARAMQLLTEELNATPTVMLTDPRPLTYQLEQP